MNKSIIVEKYPKIYFDKIGGTIKIFQNNSELSDFSSCIDFGFLQILDMTLYELSKYSHILGTRDNLNLSLDEYSKHLRHLFPTFPYRFFGFINLESIKNYLERYFIKRNLNLSAIIDENIISLKYFKKIIYKLLDNNHVILVEDEGKERIGKYYNIIGIDEENLYLVLDGEKLSISLKVYEYYNVNILYLEVNL